MRSAQDSVGGSGTPIYDALYAEYRRLFRTLPGDRSGEEQLQFSGFSTWRPPHQQSATAGRHRGYGGPAALPPGRGDNRVR